MKPEDIFLSFDLTAEEENDYNQVKSKFEKHFVVKRNVILERGKLNSRIQREGKSVDSCNHGLVYMALRGTAILMR